MRQGLDRTTKCPEELTLVLGGTGRKRLPRSLSMGAIKDVWRDSRDSGSKPGAPGIDGLKAPQFASDLADQIARLQEDLRAGSYRFSQLRLAKLVKDSGAYRILAIPTVRDRLVQRALLRHLEADPRFQPSSSISYGFTKQRTLAAAQRQALQLRQTRPWVLKCDIVRFFDCIPRKPLKQLIRRRVGWKLVAELLCQSVDCELRELGEEDREFVNANGVQRGLGLRQGMPVSPMLSNLLLKNFDEGLERSGTVAVRYADDIAIFANSRKECVDALRRVQAGLSKLELKVPDLLSADKTTIFGPTEAVEFLGVEMRLKGDGYHLCAPTKKIAKIEAAMSSMRKVETCIIEKRNIGQVVRALDSFVIGHAAAMAVLDDGGAFMGRLEKVKGQQLSALLVELLGPNVVAGLNSDSLAILGVEPFQETKSTKARRKR